MKRTMMIAATGVALCLWSASDAQAQMTWTDKGFVNVSFGAQAPSQSLTAETNPDIYGEPASFVGTQDVAGGALFDIAGGYKVWRNLAVGVGFTHVGSKSDMPVDASIPDPIFFDRPRAVSTVLPDAKHSQTGIDLTATWFQPVTDKIDVGYQFGPTIFLVSQDLPGIPDISEPGPVITNLPRETVDKTTVGLHFGVDVAYMVTPRWGAGVLVRYTWGSVDLGDNTDESLTLGGFQIGGGVRVRF